MKRLIMRLLPRLGPRIKPLLFRYWRISRGMTLGVRCALFDEDGRVLLVKHTYTPGWHFPGGGVEPGETLIEAVQKEVREETGINLTIRPRLQGVFLNRKGANRDHVALFVCRQWQRVENHIADYEISDVKLFALDALPPDITASTAQRLNELVHQTPMSDEW